MNQSILIVDDERLAREVVSNALSELGYTIQVASDGNSALQMIADKRPDLVLLDLIMPGMHGFQVLEVLRADPATQNIQVIVLTARSGQDVLRKALDSGADDFISKPFQLGEVIARVHAQLRIAQYARQLDRQRRDGEVLLEISHQLTSHLEPRAILQEVIRTVATVLGTDRGSIVLVEDDGTSGRVVAASDENAMIERRIQLTEYPEIQRVLHTHEPLVISDIAADPLFDPVKDQMAQLDVRSSILFPLVDGELCIGVLFLRSSRPRETVTKRQQQFGQIVANATAVAVSNARVFAEIREESDRISQAHSMVQQRLRFVQRYEDFFENSADAIFVTNETGRVLFMNRQAESLADRPRSVGCGDLLARLVEHSDQRAVTDLLMSIDDVAAPRVDVRFTGGRIANLSAARVTGHAAYTITARDVTEERALARELAQTKNFLQRLIDTSADAVVATDLQGNILVYSKAAEHLFGYPTADVLNNMHIGQLYPKGSAAKIIASIQEADHGGVGRINPPIEHRIISHDGTLIPVLLGGALVRDGNETAVVVIMQDQRDRIAMQAALQQTRAQLKEQEKAALLAELAGSTAHELNQPLTSVMGYAELLARRIEGDDLVQKAVRTIQSEAQRMADIVRKIGTLTRYETKPYVGSTRIIDLAASSCHDNSEDGTNLADSTES